MPQLEDYLHALLLVILDLQRRHRLLHVVVERVQVDDVVQERERFLDAAGLRGAVEVVVGEDVIAVEEIVDADVEILGSPEKGQQGFDVGT